MLQQQLRLKKEVFSEDFEETLHNTQTGKKNHSLEFFLLLK